MTEEQLLFVCHYYAHLLARDRSQNHARVDKRAASLLLAEEVALSFKIFVEIFDADQATCNILIDPVAPPGIAARAATEGLRIRLLNEHDRALGQPLKVTLSVMASRVKVSLVQAVTSKLGVVSIPAHVLVHGFTNKLETHRQKVASVRDVSDFM